MTKYLFVNPTQAERERIMSNIKVLDDGCWLWTGGKDQYGYGMTFYRGIRERSHRVVYSMIIGPIPKGVDARRHAQLDHVCKNKSCCNPEHLELVTQRENVLRGDSPPAQNALKTLCKYGHELTTTPSGRRDCRTCDNARHAKRMVGKDADYWRAKAREATARYRKKTKIAV